MACFRPGAAMAATASTPSATSPRLRWLKNQVDAGVSISRAVALLEIRHRAGEEPELDFERAAQQVGPSENVRGTETIVEELVETLILFQEPHAEAVLGEAFALYPVDVVAEEIITPTLVEIGDRWHRGEASIVQEHFATAFLRRRLTALFHAYPQPLTGPLAITGSGPHEWHDVGILLVSLSLRRHGWRVIYLGQNVPAEHLLPRSAQAEAGHVVPVGGDPRKRGRAGRGLSGSSATCPSPSRTWYSAAGPSPHTPSWPNASKAPRLPLLHVTW